MTINRSEAARAMAKAIAYKQCGKDAEAAGVGPGIDPHSRMR
jgi:hypothetical protein